MRLAMAALAVAGIGVAGYLTWAHYADVAPICATGGGCETVQQSSYAELGGVPVAILGLGGYLAILTGLLVPGEAARLATAGIALVGAGFSAYLTYLELFVIDAICQWCVASAVIMVALAVLGLLRVFRPALPHEASRTEYTGVPAPAREAG
jgi:uncharacterized membrane protein